jgi:hypothetical protein
MDSIKKKRAILGIRKDIILSWCLDSLTDSVISAISQDRLRRGTKKNRNRRVRHKGESAIGLIKSLYF